MALASVDEVTLLSNDSPFDDLSDDEGADALPYQPRLPHELDELLGEFVDVLYGAEPPDSEAAAARREAEDGMMDDTMVDAIDLAVVESSLSGSQPPSSPASLSAESGTLLLADAGEEGAPFLRDAFGYNSASSSPHHSSSVSSFGAHHPPTATGNGSPTMMMTNSAADATAHQQ